MTQLETFGDRKTYLSVNGGKIKQKVNEGTPGAIRRDYELKNGTKGVKWELEYKQIKGKISGLRIKDSDFGEMLEISFPEYVLTISVASKYFKPFVQKIAGADINQEVTIRPYDYEKDGNRIVGFAISQNGKDLENFFWDKTKNDGKGGYIDSYPKPQGDTNTFKKADWTIYYIGVDKFLAKIVEELNSQIITQGSAETESAPESTLANPLGEAQKMMGGKLIEDEIRIEDVPF